MHKSSFKFLSLPAVCCLLISCAANTNRDIGAVGGAVVGGGVGAVAGEAAGSTIGGLIIGSATGAIVGGLIGREQDVNQIDAAGQEATLQKQQQVFERQRDEIDDIKRQRYYDQKLREISERKRLESETVMNSYEQPGPREIAVRPLDPNYPNGFRIRQPYVEPGDSEVSAEAPTGVSEGVERY